MADEGTALLGYWWRPGDDPRSDRQPGRLVVNPDDSVRVEILGGFPPMAVVPAGEAGAGTLRQVSPFPVIFGQCGDEAFTLLNVTASNSSGGVVERPDRQTLEPLRALRGSAFVLDPDADIVHGVSLQIDYLLFFSHLTVFDLKEIQFSQEVGETQSSGSVIVPRSLTATWRDMTFTVELVYTDFFPKYEHANLQHLMASQRAELDIRFDQPRSIAETDRISKQMQDLLTLAMNRPCAVRRTKYKVTLPEPRDDWERERKKYAPEFNLSVHGRQIFRPGTEPYRDPGLDYVFTVDDLAFAEVVPRWLDLYDKATVGMQMLLGSRYLDVGYVSTRLTTVCVALEAIHASLYDAPRLNEHEFNQLLASALAGVENEAHRALITQGLTNRLTYRNRAKGLTEILPNDICAALFGKSRLWKDKLTQARNDLAHANEAGHNAGEQLFLMLITQFFLNLIVAKEVGISDERLREFVGHSWNLTNRWKEVTGQQ